MQSTGYPDTTLRYGGLQDWTVLSLAVQCFTWKPISIFLCFGRTQKVMQLFLGFSAFLVYLKLRNINYVQVKKGQKFYIAWTLGFLLFIIQLRSCQDASTALLVGIWWVDETTNLAEQLWRMLCYGPALSVGFAFRIQTSPEVFCSS